MAFFEVANLAISPDHGWLAYATDTTGGEIFDLTFRRLAAAPGTAGRGSRATETVRDTYYGLAWAADNETVFYTRVDEAMRPYQLWRHRVGTDPAADVRVLEEPDERFTLSVGKTKDGEYVVVVLQSNTTSEIWVVPAADPAAAPRLVEGRRPGVEYGIEHHRDRASGRRSVRDRHERRGPRLPPRRRPGRPTGPDALAGGRPPPPGDAVGGRRRLR